MNTIKPDSPFKNVINPLEEIIAYEYLWSNRKTSFKRIAEFVKQQNNDKVSKHVSVAAVAGISSFIFNILKNRDIGYPINYLIKGINDYPKSLLDAKYPLEVLYYSGNKEYLFMPSVSIVGSRKPSEEGLKRAKQMVKALVEDNFIIASGLASGIDTCAHETAIESGGKTIAVIGTPLDKFYPKENVELQKFIANNHLLVSQVPFFRYSQQGINGNKLFFPERNKTMSAISQATIIIEASETSGTLIQARAALEQGRKLFILNSCFENPNITWPEKFEAKGAIRVREYKDVKEAIKNVAST